MSKSPGIGRPGVPRRSTEQVRGALLDAAAALFARRGYASASTKEIAHAAGTSETAVYKHFESKAQLFRAAVLVPFTGFIEDYTEAFRNQMASDKNDYELIHATIRAMFDHFDQHRNSLLALIAASGDPEAEPAMRDATTLMNEMYDQLHGLTVERWQDGGGFPLERSKLWLRMMAGMMTSLTALEPMFVPGGTDRPTRDELIDTACDLLLYGLLPEKPQQYKDGLKPRRA